MAYRREHTGVCIRCGDPMGIGVHDGVCKPCEAAAVHARRARVCGWWRDGLTLRQIAGRLGWTPNHLRAEVNRMRAAGYDLPYRRTPEQVARITAGTAAARARRQAA